MNYINKLLSYKRMIGISNRSIVLVIILTLLSGFFETLGIGMFYPVFQFMKNGNLDSGSERSEMVQNIYSYSDSVGIEPTMATVLLLIFILFVFRQFFMYVKNVYLSKLHFFILKRLRDRIFKKYISSKIEYQDFLQAGVFTNIVINESNIAVTGAMGPIVLITHLIMLLILISLLLMISPYTTVIAFLILTISIRATHYWVNKSEVVGRELVSINTSVASFLIERLKSVRLIKLSRSEDTELLNFKDKSEEQRNYQVLSSILKNKTNLVLDPVIIGMGLLFLYLSYTYASISIELIGVYFIVIVRILPVAKAIILTWQKIKGSFGSIDVVYQKIKEMTEFEDVDEKSAVHLLDSVNTIEYKNVSYSYPSSEEEAIHNISFKIKSGDMISLAGPSGGGKSTIIDLLPALRNPSSGEISVNNNSLKYYTTSSIRNNISYIQQNPQIFTSTIREHIGYGNSNISLAEIKYAAELSGASNFIDKLKNGYDTLLDDNADNLSGGQRRRLDLARALASKSSILILDEPTSSLDIESEQFFINTLLNIKDKTNTTIILVAHSLTSVSYSDNIFIINGGIIEEQGTHVELLRNNGWYAKAWKMQQ